MLGQEISCYAILQKMMETNEDWEKLSAIITAVIQQLIRDDQATR